MNIRPINTVKNFVARKVDQHKAAQYAMEQLDDMYGDAIQYFSTFKNKRGDVAVLGYPKKTGPYTHAYSILSSGEHIQTLASRSGKTKDGFIDTFTRLIDHGDGKYTAESSTVKRALNGAILDVKRDAGDFFMKKKESKLIDATDLFTKSVR